MTRYARPTGRCQWQHCLTAFDSNLLQVLILYELIPSVGTKKKHLKGAFLQNLVGRAGFEPATN